MAVSFLLPETFNAGEFLKTSTLRRRTDDANYFVSLILTKLSRWAVDNSGAVRLHSDHLRKVMDGHDLADVIEALIEGGAVKRLPYVVGSKSFGYRLSDRYKNDKHVRVAATDTRIIRRIEKFHATERQESDEQMLPVHQFLAKQQQRLGIIGDEAREIIQDFPDSNPFDIQGILIRDIEDKRFRLSIGQYGRVTNNITNLKRELRPTLCVGHTKLTSVDLSCAQPAFVAKLMLDHQAISGKTEPIDLRDLTENGDSAVLKKNVRKGGRREAGSSKHEWSRYGGQEMYSSSHDFVRYCSLTQTGEFYEVLAKACCLSRTEAKTRFMADVLAKKKANSDGAEYPSHVEDVFGELFPTVYRFIRNVNKGGFEHENLIRELQRQESGFVIGIVADWLAAQYPEVFALTLHDAIYATPRDLPTIQKALDHGFAKTGFSLATKVD